MNTMSPERSYLFDSPEAELLVCCARTQLGDAQRVRILQLTQGPLDWAALRTLARRHALLPLLYSHLRGAVGAHVPDNALAQLHADYQQNVRHSLLLTSALVQCIRACQAQSITVLAYKGPVSATLAYGDLSLRHYVDLDVIVQPSDVFRVSELLLAQGYTLTPDFPPALRPSLLKYGCEVHLVERARQFRLELHWNFAQPYLGVAFDLPRIWQRAQSLSLGGTSISTPSPADTLLINCVHGAKHRWERLAWVCDAAELLRADDALDLDALLADARARGLARVVLLGLHLAHSVLDCALPSAVVQQIERDRAIARIAAQVQRQWLSASTFDERPLNAWFFAQTRERWQERLRFVARFVTTPYMDEHDQWTLQRLPHVAAPLLGLTRFMRRYVLAPQLFKRAWS